MSAAIRYRTAIVLPALFAFMAAMLFVPTSDGQAIRKFRPRFEYPDELMAAIGEDGHLWIDGGPVELIKGQAVSTWTDLIQGLKATQATGSEQPIAQDSILTGRKVITLDGDDYLQTGLFASALIQPTTIYAVVRDSQGPLAGSRTVFTGVHTDNRHTVMSDTIWKLTSGSAAISFIAAPADSVPHLIVAEFNDGGDENNTNLYIDGALVSRPHGNSGPDTLTGVTIGANAAGGLNFQGEISAIVVKPGLRSVAVETELTAYLNLDNYLNNEVTELIYEIGYDTHLWIDGGNELVNTESVSTWTDLVQGLEAVQDTVSKQPVAQLDGATGRLELVFTRGNSQSLQTGSFPAELTQPTTIYVVHEINYAESSKHLQRDVFDGIDNTKNWIFASTSTTWRVNSGAWGTYSAFDNSGMVHLFSVEVNQPNSKLYIDGVDSGFMLDTGTETMSGLTIASNSAQSVVFWDGELLAIVIDPGLRDSSVETAINDYLNNPVTLP